MDARRDGLQAYYEEEARQELRKPLAGRRVALRDEFIATLASEGRTSVVDFGAGPGRDGEGFEPAGVRYVGIDLAHGNGVLAARRGITVVHGSVTAPPFRPRSFDAGWSMSTLMHLAAHDAGAAARAMAHTVQPGAPILIGVWGGEGQDENESIIDGFDRPFSLRTIEQNSEIFSTAGEVELAERWESDYSHWHYQVFLLRSGG